MSKKIYFAGPLFNEAEKNFNVKVANILEQAGYEVFLPQRDGYEAAALDGKSPNEKLSLIFNKDVGEIKKAHIIFMVLDGRVPDDGACVELGIAFALDKICIGIKTDCRSLEKDLDLNPLIEGCFSKIFKGNTAVNELKAFLKTNTF